MRPYPGLFARNIKWPESTLFRSLWTNDACFGHRTRGWTVSLGRWDTRGQRLLGDQLSKRIQRGPTDVRLPQSTIGKIEGQQVL